MNFDEAKRTRRLEQKALIRLLKSDGYERIPTDLPGGAMFESPAGHLVVMSVPSAMDESDPFYRNNQEIDCWIIDTDGELHQTLHDATSWRLDEVLP